MRRVARPAGLFPAPPTPPPRSSSRVIEPRNEPLNNHFATEQIFRGTNNFSHYAAAPRPNIALPRTPCSSFWTALGLMLVTLFRGDAVDEARGPVRWLVKIATPKRRLALPVSGASTPARGFRQVRVHAVAKTGDLSKARRLAAIEDARARAAIDRAQRQFDAQKADIVDLTEGEAWSLAVEWLLENEKRAPVDRTRRRGTFQHRWHCRRRFTRGCARRGGKVAAAQRHWRGHASSGSRMGSGPNAASTMRWTH